MEVKYAGADYSGVSIVNGCIAVTAPEEKQEVQTDNNNEDKE